MLGGRVVAGRVASVEWKAAAAAVFISKKQTQVREEPSGWYGES